MSANPQQPQPERASKPFDAYHKWLGIPPAEQPPHFYRLLALEPFESDPEVIESAANRQMSYVKQCGTGPQSAASQKLLNELSTARLTLLNPDKKAAYDLNLNVQLEDNTAETETIARARRSSSVPLLAGIAVAVVSLIAVAGWVLSGGNEGTTDGTPIDVADSSQQPAQALADAPVPVEPAATSQKSESPNAPPSAADSANTVAAMEKTQQAAPSAPVTAPESNGSTPKTVPSSPSSTTSSSAAPSETATPPTAAPTTTDDKPTVVETPAPALLPIPEAAARDKTLAAIQDLFKDDYATAKTQEQQYELAKKLLQQGKRTTDDPVARYVLYCEARDLSCEAGVIETALDAIDEIAAGYEIDLWKEREEAFNRSLIRARQPGQIKVFLDTAYLAVEKAILLDRYELAVSICGMAVTAARKTRDKEMNARSLELRTRVLDLRKVHDAAETAAKTLETMPDDPQANLTRGVYLCLHRNNWPAGLPHLAKSGDAGLMKAAELDLAGPATSEAQMQAGDAWWDWVESTRSKENRRFLSAVVFWYSSALPNLNGLDKLKVEKRLQEMGQIETVRLDSAPSSAGGALSGSVVSPIFPNTYNAEVEKKAAEWALSAGATVTVGVNGRETVAKNKSDLPARAFVVTKIEFRYGARFRGDDLQNIAKLSGIKKLLINGTGVADGMVHLQNLKSLEELTVSRAGLNDDNLKSVKELTQLKTLSFSSNSITGSGIEHLKELKDLEALNFGFVPIEDAGLAHLKNLPKLKHLGLWDSQVTDEGLKHLYDLKSLKVFHIYRSKVTREGLDELRRQRPGISIL